MLTRNLLFRIAGPTIFVSLLFLGSCITAAIYLHHQQSASLRVLDEAITSRKIAGDLLKALDDLAALPADRWGEAGALHEHILGLLAEARRGVDKSEEARLVGRLEDSFGRYLRRAAQAASGPASEAGLGGPPHPGGGGRADLPRAGALQRRGDRALRGHPPSDGLVDGLGVGRGGHRRLARRSAHGLRRGPRAGPVRAAGRDAGGGRAARRRHGPRAQEPPDRDQDAGPDQPRGGGGTGPARGGPATSSSRRSSAWRGG